MSAFWNGIMSALAARLDIVAWPSGLRVAVTQFASESQRFAADAQLWVNLRDSGEVPESEAVIGGGWQWVRRAEIDLTVAAGAESAAMLFAAHAALAAALPWLSETLGGRCDALAVLPMGPVEAVEIGGEDGAGLELFAAVVPVEIHYESSGPEG